jgi:intraflagellar transport protein 172
MYVNVGRWEKAESIIKKYMKNEESSKIILDEANKYEHEGKIKEAEKLYILAGEHDDAISMYKSLKQYDNMIRLVSLYRQDFLKSTHQMVASYLEAEGNLKLAEKHYIESGNWKSCVEMYRSQNMWEEALRVAKSNGSKGEVNEIAKKWVLNLSKDQQIKMLLSMGLGEACIDILCDSKDYEAAFKLSEQHERYKIPDVHLRYAMELEDEKRYHDAEEHYIKANQVQEVIQMYEHIGDYQSALRISRQHDPSSVVNIYFNQGKHFLISKEYVKAEICFVNAKQAEYMVKIYIQERNFPSALKFASKYAPQLENDIRTQMLIQGNKPIETMSGEELENMAKLCEDSKDFSRAIETYLAITEKEIKNIDKLEQLWNKAVNLALEHDKNRAHEVVYEVAIKFKNVGKYNEAANLFENISKIEEAVQCYVELKNYERALKVAQSIKNPDQRQKIISVIENRRGNNLVNNDDPVSLIQLKDKRGLEMLYSRGEYDRCLESAEQFNPEIFNEFLILVVKKYLANKNLAGTADLLERHRTPIYKYNLELYKELALEILAEENLDELKSLKDMLICVSKQLPEYEEFKDIGKILNRLQKIAYYQFIKFSIKQKKDGFSKTYFRVCLAVLAFGDIIKLDLALLDAGNACREVGSKANGFILLNRYLDMYEVIEDPSIKLEEESELKDTEITQIDPFRSEANIISPSQKEEIHEWIVKTSVDKGLTKSLNRRPCPKCGKNVFEANSMCKSCGYAFDCCIVSGFPIHSGIEKVSCTSCGKNSIRECWREWIGTFEQCPWCRSVQMSYK